MATRIPDIDQYSPLSHKLPFRDGAARLAPTWVPTTQIRRLDAYKVLAAYRGNVARNFLPDLEGAGDRREYGDAELLVQRTASGVLGDTIQLIVDGADDDLADEPDLPPHPGTAPADDAPEVEKRVHAARLARWEEQAAAIVDQWEADWAAQPSLIARQEWLRGWADSEFLIGKIVEAEGDVAGLGDGVYVLDWSTADQRPVVDVYDPGFYFPVLDDNTRGYPRKIHLAWEYDVTLPNGATERHVRRLTYELAPIPTAVDANGDVIVNDTPDGQFLQLQDGDRYNPDTGQVVRIYPWAEPDPDTGQLEESAVTCLFTDATWPLNQIVNGQHVDDFDSGKATYQTTADGRTARRLDMRLDFLPIVHIPNTPATREHFGRSILDVVAQVLDDLSASDTDIQDASAIAAGPVLVLKGGTSGDKVVRPGIVWNVPQDGGMDVLDLSQGLAELGKVNVALQDRLSVNARIPAEVLGRAKQGDIKSGVHLLLTFGPFRQLVEFLRLTRDPKYRLMLKMVQRLGQAGGVLEPGPNPVARVVFGSYLPADLSAVVESVVKLLMQHGISRLTALRMLTDAGLDVGDLVDEIARIEAEDAATALQLAEATGSEELAATKLGLVLPDTATPPVGPPTLNLPTPPATPPGGP